MKILLDECMDESLRHQFIGHDCQSCRFAGFKGLTNGELIAAAEKNGFEVLITVDQNLPRQQSARNRTLSIIMLQARTTNIDDLIVLMPAILAGLKRIKPGHCISIGR